MILYHHRYHKRNDVAEAINLCSISHFKSYDKEQFSNLGGMHSASTQYSVWCYNSLSACMCTHHIHLFKGVLLRGSYGDSIVCFILACSDELHQETFDDEINGRVGYDGSKLFLYNGQSESPLTFPT